jgi:tyrosine-protein kinase Etk/Wzc
MGINPVRTAAIVNAVVAREVEVATDLKKAKLTELTKILEDQLATAGTNLRAAENALESFRIHTATLPTDQATPVAPGLMITQNPVMNSFFQMKVDREQLRRDQLAIQSVLTQVPDSGLSVDAMMVIPSVSNSQELKDALLELTKKEADLRALRYKYTDATPMVADAASQVDSLERRIIPGLARALLTQIATRLQTLDSRVAAAGVDLQQIPARTIEEARLQRAVSIAENLNNTLQSRYEEAHLAEASSIPDVRTLDQAVAPEKPVSNTGPKVLMLGFIAGLGLGLTGAVLLDRMDKRVRYPEQVTGELGLPILGTLPRVSKNGDSHSDEMSHVVESLRSIRLNLAHAYGAAGPLLVTISSPGSGDGKSFLSSNLAIAFADAGFSTLLIDGDLRRGALHRVMKAQRKPGLTDFLSGALPKDKIIQATPYPLLSFIGGGTRKQTAPELLGTPAMRELVMGLRTSYNVILIDSPPLGAAVDPFMLATLTGNLVVVLRTGATDRELARAKLEMLDRLPVRILGAVLNDVRADGIYRYYGYLAGYEAEEERDAGKRIPAAVS